VFNLLDVGEDGFGSMLDGHVCRMLEPDLAGTPVEREAQLNVLLRDEEVTGSFECWTSCYKRATAERLVERYGAIVARIVCEPSQPFSALLRRA